MEAKPIVHNAENVVVHDNIYVKDSDSENLAEESLIKEKTDPKGIMVCIRIYLHRMIRRNYIGHVVNRTFCYYISKSYVKDRDSKEKGNNR